MRRWLIVSLPLLVCGCDGPREILTRLPYCALPAPCTTDEQCVNRYTLSAPELATCDRGQCVTEYRCRSDEECAEGEVCAFVSSHVDGVGTYACSTDCSIVDCSPPPLPATPTGACLTEGCAEGQGCVELLRNVYGCLQRCSDDGDCGLGPSYGDFCFEGYCIQAECLDGADYGCGAGLECRNNLPPRAY